MRALVWHGPGEHRAGVVADPRAARGEVLIAPRLVGICGSDVSAHLGKMGTARPGAIRGHEFGGIVAESADPLLPVGTRVAVNPVVSCSVCRSCVAGFESACADIEIIGVHRPGAFAELVAVPVRQVHRVAPASGWLEAASAEPLAQAVHDVELARADGRELGRCLVIGGGAIGGWIVAVLQQCAATETVVVEPDVRRHPSLGALGATVIATAEGDAGIASGYDTVFDVVGVAATRALALEATRSGGLVVAVGLGADEASVSWFDLVRRELTVRGANAFGPADYARALAWLEAGRVRPPEPGGIVPLHEGARAFDDLTGGRAPSGKIYLAVGEP